ncbi:MAG: alanine--tRNA ligase [Gemmatimonadota bacterium]
MKASEIRSRFVEFFERAGHLHLPSAPLVPADDPTLLFTNAGMVPFKRAFLGRQEPAGPRVVTVQKCLRVSGKHNDLEEVGRTARHHTFFEMLGNFSFGDYFKEEAIRFAWEFVTAELGLEPDRLWATVHRDDERARALWLEVSEIPPERVLGLGDRENFWQMAETGPCGPCSELHYDVRPPDAPRSLTPEEFLLAGEADHFMEIWNLVFMQFDRGEDGRDRPLPAPSIDTGAGLERIAAVLQGKRTNYHTDLFLPLIEEAEEVVGRRYPREPEDWEEGLPFRVLADHARAVAFLLADGVFPSNEGRGYVLRRILRRAGRYAWLLGRREPTLVRLVDRTVAMLADVYPELETRRHHLAETARAEEERFLATIEEGMRRFDEVAPPGPVAPGVLSGEDAFRLYDTFGFPLDLTQLMAAERGYRVDVDGFHTALELQRARSREDRGSGGGEAGRMEEIAALVTEGEQEFVGYGELRVETRVLAFERRDGRAFFILERNPFYAEAGGQVADSGRVSGEGWQVEVRTVGRNERGQTVLAGPVVRGSLPRTAPEGVLAEVEEGARRDTERNHTATHLLHAALRAELGDHVHQAGSLVAPDRLRFDFSHRGPLSPAEQRAVERRVNQAIWDNLPVRAEHRPYREALKAGAMALFGEKYGDVVRTIQVPGVSLELCGGCHVAFTGQIGLFKIVAETGIAAGIRRIEALTGPGAYDRALRMEELVGELARELLVPPAELPERVRRLRREAERLAEEAAGRREEAAGRLAARLVEERADPVDGSRLLAHGHVPLPPDSDLAEFGDRLREQIRSGAAIVHVVVGDEREERREAFLSVVTDDWVRGGLKAGDLVKLASGATGSRGGGRAHFARGGVGDPSRVEEALEVARERAAAAMRRESP